jgi:hypothetical protein
MDKKEEEFLDIDSDTNEDPKREELLDESLKTFIEEKVRKT